VLLCLHGCNGATSRRCGHRVGSAADPAAVQGNLKKVQRLDCSNNLLARIPPSMGHLKFLKEFGLRYNSLDDR